MLMQRIETPAEKAEKLLPQIDSIFCGTLSGEKARKVILEGEAVLLELEQMKNGEASINPLIESLKSSIEMAKREISNEP